MSALKKKTFKEKYTLDERKKDAEKKRKEFPQHIPIILEKHKDAKINDLEKTKYLVADDLKLYEFQQNIRKKLTLGPTEGLFFFIAGKKLDQLNSIVKNVYESSKDEDGYLYITYSNIEKFGYMEE